MYSGFTAPLIALFEVPARIITHISKLTNKLGLTKKMDLSFIIAYDKSLGNKNALTFMEIIKHQGANIVKTYKDLGLKKTAKVLGTKLW